MSTSEIIGDSLTLRSRLHYNQADVTSRFWTPLWQSQAKSVSSLVCGSHRGSASLPCLELLVASAPQSGLEPAAHARLEGSLLSRVPCSSLS